MVKLLNCQEIVLPRIKNLEIGYDFANNPISDLHMSVYFEFRNSLTDLELCSLVDLDRPYLPFGGMYKYIASFTNLTRLNCNSFSSFVFHDDAPQPLNIGMILEGNKYKKISHLKDLTLSNVNQRSITTNNDCQRHLTAVWRNCI